MKEHQLFILENIQNGDWLGTLSEIVSTDGYWVLLEGGADLAVVGDPTDPGTEYDLDLYTNLISYPFSGFAPIDVTIPDDAQGSIDAILGEGAAALNIDNYWVGGTYGS